MKTTALFVIALFCASAYATSVNEKVSEMMKANMMANDAVDTVENLLHELKQGVLDEQADHDTLWAEQKAHGQGVIGALTQIANTNRATAE